MARPGLAVKIAVGKPKAGSDLASPADFGAPSKPPVPGNTVTDDDSDTDTDQATSTPSLPPDAVHYHDDEQRCELCDNYGQDGQCSLLQMQVQPEGGCNAFTSSQSSDDGSMGGADDTGVSQIPSASPSRPMRGGYGS